MSVLICFSIASFNAFGVAVTKNASAAQRSTIDTSRTVLIWIFFLTVKIPGVKKETFSWLQLSGFILLVAGTLVYNEIVVVRFWGFDKNTKIAREKRAKESLIEGDAGNAEGYMAVSPHAGYDATRNKRKINMKVEEAQNAKYDLGLNKSEITVEETAHKSGFSNLSNNTK